MNGTTEMISAKVQYSEFNTINNNKECNIIISYSEAESVKETCEVIFQTYLQALSNYNLSLNTQMFTRIHVSDIANQKVEIENTPLYSALRNGSVSMVEQAPLEGGLISVHSYHIKSESGKEITSSSNTWFNHSVFHGNNYQMLYTANYDDDYNLDSYKQTENIFSTMSSHIADHDMTLKNHTIRTWIYVRDIDNHYMGMVKARKRLFDEIGLTDNTRTIASTGIEGRCRNVNTLVTMDALSIKGLTEEQIVRMEAIKNMPPTIKYGVTFERGLRIKFGDRSHLYISGTASIDKEGNVVNIGNAAQQTRRAIENIQALLEPHKANLEDMQYLYVYVRNPVTFNAVKKAFYEFFPKDIPVVFLHGAVCRPGWLVEIEGVGIIPDNTEFPEFG